MKNVKLLRQLKVGAISVAAIALIVCEPFVATGQTHGNPKTENITVSDEAIRDSVDRCQSSTGATVSTILNDPTVGRPESRVRVSETELRDFSVQLQAYFSTRCTNLTTFSFSGERGGMDYYRVQVTDLREPPALVIMSRLRGQRRDITEAAYQKETSRLLAQPFTGRGLFQIPNEPENVHALSRLQAYADPELIYYLERTNGAQELLDRVDGHFSPGVLVAYYEDEYIRACSQTTKAAAFEVKSVYLKNDRVSAEGSETFQLGSDRAAILSPYLETGGAFARDRARTDAKRMLQTYDCDPLVRKNFLILAKSD